MDWIGNNYRYETYSLFKDLTIIGATGAIVDAIEIEGGTYYNTPHSQSATYPVMLSLIELKNVVIDGVTYIVNGKDVPAPPAWRIYYTFADFAKFAKVVG